MHAELGPNLSESDDLPVEIVGSALVLEADWAFRTAAADTLEHYCRRVSAPGNGLRAFDLLTEDEPPSLIVLGAPLPDLDEVAFARLAGVLSNGSTRVLGLGHRADAVLQTIRARTANQTIPDPEAEPFP